MATRHLVVLVGLAAGWSTTVAHAQPQQPPPSSQPPPVYPQPYPPQPSPPQPYPAPPYPQPVAQPPHEAKWYGYKSIVCGGVVGLLGTLLWQSDLETGPKAGLSAIGLWGGMMCGPGIHYLSDERAKPKLKRSAGLIGGAALVGLLVGFAIEGSKTDLEAANIGTSMFIGLALGAVADGIVFGYTTPKPAPGYSLYVTPRSDTTIVGVGGTF